LSYAPTVGTLPAGQFVIVTFPEMDSYRCAHKENEQVPMRRRRAGQLPERDGDSARPSIGSVFANPDEAIYERCRTSAARPLEVSLTTGRRGENESGPVLGRFSTVPMTGASSMPSA